MGFVLGASKRRRMIKVVQRIGLMLFVIFAACVLSCHNIHAKPMMAPTDQEGFDRSAHIVVAEYQGYSKGAEKVTYFDGVLADYKVVEVLKGGELSPSIKILYAFHDRSACIEPEDWTFDEKSMPAKGSRWILFLETEMGGVWQTYRGDYGRREATGPNIDDIKKLEVQPSA